MDQYLTKKNILIGCGVLVVLIIVVVVVVKMKKEKFALNGNKMVSSSGVGTPPLPTPLTYLTADTSGNLSTSSDGSFENINATGSVYLNGYPGNVGDVIVSNGASTPPVWAAGVGLSDFSSSLKTNGYQKLPGGLIIQWGVDATTLSTPFTFPTPFLTSCLGFLVSLPSSNSANQTPDVLVPQGAALSNTTYQVGTWCGGSCGGWYGSAQVQWLAFGF